MNSYMAIWYLCNQHCTGCPCTLGIDRSKSMSIHDIRCHVETLIASSREDEPIHITMSGGEPTLHPDFFQIIDLMKEKGIYLTILSNSEKFGDQAFCNEFLKHCNILRTHIVTTIHSSSPDIHERQNGSPGSFDKSIRGLKYLYIRGIKITIKHCITGVNAEDTNNFIQMVDENFHPNVDIELWGLDYCGLTKEQAEKLFKPYSEMKSSIEQALDSCIAANARNGRRTLVCNIPLCAVDPFYWHMFRLRTQNFAYARYFDPQHELVNQDDDSGTFSKKCSHCAVHDICAGTYRSVFEYFGDDTISAVHCYKEGGDNP